MKGIGLLVVAAAAIGIGACAPAGSGSKMSDSTTMASDLAAVNKMRDDYAAAFKAGDAAAVAALYTSDGFSQGNEQPTGMGKEGIAAGNKALFDNYTIQSVTLTPVKTEVSGTLGYDIGTYAFVAAPKAKGDTLKAQGRYVVVLRKQPDGSWKAIADMDNVVAPPMAPAPPGKKK
jgi:uncharacterized protein (TIGR02246 family)